MFLHQIIFNSGSFRQLHIALRNNNNRTNRTYLRVSIATYV